MKGVDTNVLVRYLVRDDPAMAERAEEFLEGECLPHDPCMVNRIVLAEMAWVLRRTYRYERDEIATALDMIMRTDRFVVENEAASMTALDSYRDGSADFADRLIAETNVVLGCSETATFDRAAGRHPHFRYIGDSK